MTGLPFCEGLDPPLVNTLLAAHLCKLSLFSLAMDLTALFMYHISLRKYAGTCRSDLETMAYWPDIPSSRNRLLSLPRTRLIVVEIPHQKPVPKQEKISTKINICKFPFPFLLLGLNSFVFMLGEDETWTCSPEWATQFRLGPWTSYVDQVHRPPAI